MPDLVLAIKGDVELDSAIRATGRDLDTIADQADDAAEDIRSSFSDAGDDIERALARAARDAEAQAADIERAFAGTGDDVGDEFERIADEARESASDTGRAFSGVADDIDDEFDLASAGVRRSLSRIEGEADDAADGMVAPFSRAADRIEDEFSGLGEEIGEDLDLTSGLEDSFANIDLSSGTSAITSQLGSLAAVGGPIGAIAGTAGAIFGDDLLEGFEREFGSRRRGAIAAVRTGFGPAQLGEIGEDAGEAYAAGFGDSLTDLTFEAQGLEKTLAGVDDSFASDELLRKGKAVEEVFGVDFPEAILLARRLFANDLVPSVDAGLNLIAETARELPFEFDEALEVLDEFAPVLRKLGIDGPAAINLIIEAMRSGLVTGISRIGELFEEFNIQLGEAGTLAEPLAELGLPIEELQDQLARGDGAEALNRVVTALIDMGDETKRNQLITDIFGASIESVGDPETVLNLLAIADAEGEIGTAADEAQAAIEANVSGFDRLQKAAEGLGAQYASLGNAELEFFFKGIDAADEFTVSLFGLEQQSGFTQSAVDQVTAIEAVSALDDLAGGITEVDDELGDLEESLDETTSAVEELDEAIAEFSGRFDSDRVFRSIEEDTLAALEATEGLTAASFDLSTGFDTTTESGRKAEASLEDLSGNLDSLIRGYQEGTITGRALSAGQEQIEASVRDVARQLKLSDEATEALVARYATVPGEVTTDVIARDMATRALEDIASKIRAIPTERVVTVRTRFGSRTINTQQIPEFGSGGLAEGLAIVGDEGPELIDFRTPTRVYSHEDTAALFGGSIPEFDDSGRLSPEARASIITNSIGAEARAEAAASGSGVTGRRGVVNIDQVVVAEGEDLWQQLALVEQLYEVAL